MRVVKFGGTSVANADNLVRCIDIIKNISKQEPVIVVVSALGGVTDLLQEAANKAAGKQEDYKNIYEEIVKRHLDLVRALIPVSKQAGVLSSVLRKLNSLELLLQGCFYLGELSPQTKDTIFSYGERLSSLILSKILIEQGENCQLAKSRALIKTNNCFGKAVVNFPLTNLLIQNYFKNYLCDITIAAGFVGESEDMLITTLGRGGSDYTASIIAAALDVKEVEIWTDVSGIYTANPKLVKQARVIDEINFQEAMELSHFGAKVLYPAALEPILPKNITMRIKNTFAPEERGSIISNGLVDKTLNPIKGISNIDNIAVLMLEGPGMIGVVGVSRRLFEVLSNEGINVVFITQASSEYSICFGIVQQDAKRAEKVINDAFQFEIEMKKVKPVLVELNRSIVAIVGDNIKSHQGLSGKMLSVLGRNNVNIIAIAQGASERNISAVILQKDVKKALNVLHEAFFEEAVVQLNLFVMGIGNVGNMFLQQIEAQKKYLKKNLKLNIRVIGIANSKRMAFDEEGIELTNYQAFLENKGEVVSQQAFFERVKQLNLRNSVFVDNTASQEVAMGYANYLKHSIAIVTCNKVACSSDYAYYKQLKELSRKYNAPFLYETNVGAGLPIIDTLKNLVASGDCVKEIHAVLSGSLNFIFNNYNAEESFASVVKQAQLEGYTEPNPLIDLSGIDVLRKLLILLRESGKVIEEADIVKDSFLPEDCLNAGNVEAFYSALEHQEPYFKQLYEQAKQRDARLKFVATYDNGLAKVGLTEIPKDHPFYHLEGKDNIVLFYTDRYEDQPLLIKGAGAGASVTASGIFADVIRIGNKLN